MKRQSYLSNRWADFFAKVADVSGISCKIQFPSGKSENFGSDKPQFTLLIKSTDFLAGRFDEFTFGKAYVDDKIDIEGDMLSIYELRDHLKDKRSLRLLLKFWSALLFVSPTRVNRKAISSHYSFSDDFYLTFIDSRFRFYSHCIFHSDDETLEEAAEHKLESMYDALELESGNRLLDIGCGWGGVTAYCGDRGISVTGLTIAQDSYNYTANLIKSNGYTDCSVYHEDILDHHPEEPYDAVVIFGVIEHIPYYRRFFEKIWDVLKPGGLIYLDASATKVKFDVTDFTRQYTFSGTHTFLTVQDIIQELVFHGLDLVEVKQETHDYELTMWHWAQRLDANREIIVQRWGTEVYRAFRIFLWGGCHAFRTDRLQAYHLVARRGNDPGPRPGLWRRTRIFIKSLA
ncbi:MAG: class I SAM-dependent methyltransferase [Candidatus Marinimicrobia bacterium]|nr:class I SAM-dependent methyltransferase [Candidatus Neomarinimicrobiota bacterium]